MHSTPVQVVFSDRTDPATGAVTDTLTSDGLGPCTDGVNGIACVIYTGGSQDLTLNLSSIRGHNYHSGAKQRLD